jgi:hypothetical protein
MTDDLLLQRLRRANPVPAPDMTDDPDLFVRITSGSGDPRLAQRARRRRPRPALVVAIALVLTAAAASTAFAVSHWNHAQVVKQPVTKREYLDAQRGLTLPPGATWPEYRMMPNTVTGKGAGGGYAVITAQHAWECYWVDTIRSRDVAGQRRAHAALEQLLANNILEAPPGAPEDWAPSPAPTVPYAVFAHDGGLQWIEANYALAAAGKPGRLIQSCKANS